MAASRLFIIGTLLLLSCVVGDTKTDDEKNTDNGYNIYMHM